MGLTTDTDRREGAKLEFTMAPGALDLIGAAITKRADVGFDCLLTGGDLATMAAQKRFLEANGFQVGQRDVYPALMSADFPRAIRLIFEQRVEGWWNLEGDLTRHQVCTSEQFRDALRSESEKKAT